MDKQRWRPNDRLKRARNLRGWSQEDLARKIGTTQKIVSRWERGENTPVPYYRQRLCKLFEKNAAELGFVDRQAQHTAYSLHEGALFQTRQGADLGSADVNRREFLHETEQAVIGLMGAEILERFYRALKKPSTLDERLLTYLELRTEEYWQDRHGAALAASDLLDYVLVHFRKLTELLEGPLLSMQRTQLCAIASKTALLIGELFIDMSYYSHARQYDEIAIKAAQESDDQALEAVTKGRMSLIWTYSENIPAALTSVQEARHLAKGIADITVCTWLAAIEAEVQANLHNCRACLKALNDAERIEYQLYTSKDRYLIHFDIALLRGYQGVCFRRLYDPEDKQSSLYLGKAQSVLIDSLNLLDSTLMQRRPTFLTDLAEAYLQQREIEESCKRATQAAICATQIKLQKVLRRLDKIRQELQPFKDTPYVKKLDEDLAPLFPLAGS